MLRNLGCSYVILGHSERKKYAGETPEMTARKTQAALLAGLIPVVCIGEHAKEEMGPILKGIPPEDVSRIVFVYEPEWAISTQPDAKPATPQGAGAALQNMRALLPNITTLLYGGSVNSKDIQGFMEAGAQGALVGAASLDAQEFIRLVKNSILR
jgi:triosephosphate isomerase